MTGWVNGRQLAEQALIHRYETVRRVNQPFLLRSDNGFRRVALIWRRSSPRENEFRLLSATLRRIIGGLVPEAPAKVLEPA